MFRSLNKKITTLIKLILKINHKTKKIKWIVSFNYLTKCFFLKKNKRGEEHTHIKISSCQNNCQKKIKYKKKIQRKLKISERKLKENTMEQSSSFHHSDEAVISTNDDASDCKKSAVRLGYWKDEYIGHFVKNPERKAPEINRGYFARVRGVEICVEKFLQVIFYKKIFFLKKKIN